MLLFLYSWSSLAAWSQEARSSRIRGPLGHGAVSGYYRSTLVWTLTVFFLALAFANLLTSQTQGGRWAWWAAPVLSQTSAEDIEDSWLSGPRSWAEARGAEVSCTAPLTHTLPRGFSPCCLTDFHKLSVHIPGRLRLETIACHTHCFLADWGVSCQSLWRDFSGRNEKLFRKKGHQGRRRIRHFRHPRHHYITAPLTDRVVSPGGAQSLRLAVSLPTLMLSFPLFLHKMKTPKELSFMEMAWNEKSGFIWHFVWFPR